GWYYLNERQEPDFVPAPNTTTTTPTTTSTSTSSSTTGMVTNSFVTTPRPRIYQTTATSIPTTTVLDCGLHGQWSSSSNDCQCESGWINNITTEGTINFCAIRLLPDQEILTTTFAPDQRKGDGTDSPAARNSSMVV
ncbi:hypothetical protein FOZ62_019680, partial [Perkinsus olseni]